MAILQSNDVHILHRNLDMTHSQQNKSQILAWQKFLRLLENAKMCFALRLFVVVQ
jgi:hypothetical protein